MCPTRKQCDIAQWTSIYYVHGLRAFAKGGGMGVFMGMLFGALDTPLHGETMTARQHVVHAARTMGSRSMHMAKTFAIMGAIFSGTECLIEKVVFLLFVSELPLTSGYVTQVLFAKVHTLLLMLL